MNYFSCLKNTFLQVVFNKAKYEKLSCFTTTNLGRLSSFSEANVFDVKEKLRNMLYILVSKICTTRNVVAEDRRLFVLNTLKNCKLKFENVNGNEEESDKKNGFR